jgi:hypothetical protein
LNAGNLVLSITTTGLPRLTLNAVAQNGTGNHEAATATPHAFCLMYDRRAAAGGLFRVDTDLSRTDHPTPFLLTGDDFKGLAGGATSSVAGLMNGLWAWVGEDAETMMDRGGTNEGGAELLSDLGW